MIRKSDDFLNGPDMLRESCFHRWSDANGLMDADKVVMHIEQRNGVHVGCAMARRRERRTA